MPTLTSFKGGDGLSMRKNANMMNFSSGFKEIWLKPFLQLWTFFSFYWVFHRKVLTRLTKQMNDNKKANNVYWLINHPGKGDNTINFLFDFINLSLKSIKFSFSSICCSLKPNIFPWYCIKQGIHLNNLFFILVSLEP